MNIIYIYIYAIIKYSIKETFYLFRIFNFHKIIIHVIIYAHAYTMLNTYTLTSLENINIYSNSIYVIILNICMYSWNIFKESIIKNI